MPATFLTWDNSTSPQLTQARLAETQLAVRWVCPGMDTRKVQVHGQIRGGTGPSAIIVMHSSPSEADIKVTRDIIPGGQLLKIEVLDHVIIGYPNRTSLRYLGYCAVELIMPSCSDDSFKTEEIAFYYLCGSA